jgi:uncharacterized cupin superfamily protein
MEKRPEFIAHWTELEDGTTADYPDTDELFAHEAQLGRKLGLTRIGIHHVRVPPGRRISYPHAESAEEEFVFVIEGNPDAWIDGRLRRLNPRDSVAFPAGTGIVHTFLNNTDAEVRLLVVGERNRPGNQRYYPRNPGFEPEYQWKDAPPRDMGPHDGRPDKSADAAGS